MEPVPLQNIFCKTCWKNHTLLWLCVITCCYLGGLYESRWPSTLCYPEASHLGSQISARTLSVLAPAPAHVAAALPDWRPRKIFIVPQHCLYKSSPSSTINRHPGAGSRGKPCCPFLLCCAWLMASSLCILNMKDKNKSSTQEWRHRGINLMFTELGNQKMSGGGSRC